MHITFFQQLQPIQKRQIHRSLQITLPGHEALGLLDAHIFGKHMGHGTCEYMWFDLMIFGDNTEIKTLSESRKFFSTGL